MCQCPDIQYIDHTVGSAGLFIRLDRGYYFTSTTFACVSYMVGDGGMVSAELDALCFFKHGIPQAVLGTKTDNKRVTKRSRSNIVLMCTWLRPRTEGKYQKGNLFQIHPVAMHLFTNKYDI